MYFNDKKENTNIDNEFNNKKKITLNFNKFKLPLIIIGIIILLVGMILIFISLNNGKEKEKKYYIFLTGEDTITIYKGDVYNEPGYSATDNLHNDLTNDVVIDNQVDTNTIGNYQITYTLNGVIKTRYVNVIKKPIGATLLYLKGSLNIYLKVGEKYIEPGYVAIDTVDSSLVDKVKINNQVDTSKAGTYRIIYSVVNSSGVTTSAIRTVIVLDSELNLNVSTNSYTNKNIKIYVNVLDNYFDYLLLPNGNKVTKSTYEYEVTKNGTYKFISYSKKGDTKEESITISNIDKTSPTGSCSGSYKDNISTINISASDNVGISKYVINGVSYTSKKITVNKAMEKANITIYDKAGNTKNVSRNLEEKNELKNNTTTNNGTTNNNTTNNNTTNSIKGKWVDISGLSCTVYAGYYVSTVIPVNVEVADQIYSILKGICGYVNSSSYLDKLQHAGAYVDREIQSWDYHSKGKAIDINNLWTYTYNGTTYMPYSGQGTNEWYNYKKFICDVCNGKEDCKQNVNYHIFVNYFKPQGWCWGGDWNIEYFDPMHYELRDEGCAVAPKKQIIC